MQKYIWSILILCVLSQNAISQNAQLEIEILGINEVKGKIQIAVYNDSEVFPEKGKAYRVECFEVTSAELNAVIKDLPHNEYAIALFHDINGDQECNLNFIGIPKEPYGFSNNIKPVLKAPSFEVTSIILNADKKIRIKLMD
ncbi:Uncharacterized conserved protein, DUF2141 family [Muriicola jejuensis]|uniref:DUF2141 domain-containing protein n=1 Tax=Muriicola jejuensis TaxID=504488 RepID=A0A6P0U8P6_9FLAO|nr:DUF2141 domain-containing protein [Muriicola jejuensis]NER08912.1 DUF2141 domain-containing protein [Muriicola jejuensis]SMP12958.1 Uncharacterized conserved protein, DUF2141 family [Muriicola jejuensis]